MISVKQARQVYTKVYKQRRYETLLTTIADLLNRRRPTSALGKAITLAVTPALQDLNDEDLCQLRYLWGLALGAIELIDDELTVFVLGCLDLALDPMKQSCGVSEVHRRMNTSNDEKRRDIADHARDRAPELGATRSRDDLNALLAVIVTVTA